MGHKTLQCFMVMCQGNPYRPFGLIVTIHAVSRKHATRLLKDKSQRFSFSVFPWLYVKENPNCSPYKIMQGDHCYYHLIAKPRYDTTPLGSMTPNSPEWSRRIDREPDFITPSREALIEHLRQRKDVGDPE